MICSKLSHASRPDLKKKKKRQWLNIEQVYVEWTFSLDFVFRT